MKLLYCNECRDVFNLTKKEKVCSCGKSVGRYLKDGLHAEFTGPAIPIGFNNPSFIAAVVESTNYWHPSGIEFTAFVIPVECKTFKKVMRMEYKND